MPPLVFNDEQRKRVLKSKGYDPGFYDIEPETGNIFFKAGPITPSANEPVTDITNPTPVVEPPSKIGSFGRGFISGIAPAFGGLGGIRGGAAIGSRLGAIGGPVGVGIGTVGGAIVGGLGGSALGARIQDYLLPESAKASLALDEATNPLSSLTGNLAAQVVGMNPVTGIANIPKAVSTVGKIGEKLLVGNKLARPFMTGEIANLANVGGGAAIGAGGQLYNDISQGQAVDPLKLALATAGGAIFNEPNKLVGQKIFGLTPTGGADFSRSKAARLAPEIQRILQSNEPNLASLAPDIRNNLALHDVAFGRVPEGYDVGIKTTGNALSPKESIAQNILPADLYEKGTEKFGGKLRKKDEIKPFKSAEESGSIIDELLKAQEVGTPDQQAARQVEEIRRRQLVLENQLKAASNVGEQNRPVVATTKNAAAVKELNYQAYKDAVARGKLKDAKFYKQAGFEERLQAENRGENVNAFGGESNTSVRGGTKFQETLPPSSDVRPELARKLEALSRENNVPLRTTKSIFDLLSKEVAEPRGVSTELNPRLKTRGQVNVDNGLAELNPETATPDTLSHEVFHKYLNSLEHSANKSDVDLAEFMKNKIADSSEYRGTNARRAAQGHAPLSVEEFLTENVGYDAVRRLYNLDKETGTFRSGFKDFLSRVKLRFGGGEVKDVARIASERLIEDENNIKNARVGTEGKSVLPKADQRETVVEGKTTVAKQPEEGQGLTKESLSLPRSYGHWISPEGEMFRTNSHEQGAINILKRLVKEGKMSKEEYDKFNIPFNSTTEVENALYKRGFARGVHEQEKIYYADTEQHQPLTNRQLSSLRNYGIERDTNITHHYGGKVSKDIYIRLVDRDRLQANEGQGLTNDLARYQELQTKFAAKMQKGEFDDEFNKIWKESEEIKNRNNGKVEGIPPSNNIPTTKTIEEPSNAPNQKQVEGSISEQHPEGSPSGKTIETGRSDSIQREAKEGGETSPKIKEQPSSTQGLTPTDINKNITKNRVDLDKGFFSKDDNALIRNLRELPFGVPGLKSDIDKFELRTGEAGKYGAPKLRELLTHESELNGRYTNPSLAAQKPLSGPEKDLLMSTMLAEKRSGSTLRSELSPKLQKAYDTQRELLALKQKDQIAANQPVVGIDSEGRPTYRTAGEDPYYFPEVVGGKQRDVLLNKQGTEDFSRLKKDFIQHVKDKYNLSDSTANDLFQEMLGSFGGTIKSDSTKFGAVRKAEGIGLPDSWLESDMDTVLRRYWRRVAKDRSFHDTIEVDDNMLNMLGRKYNPWGEEIKPDKNFDISPGNEILSGIMDTVQETNIKTNPRLDAVARIVNNLILGPLTGVNDVINAIPLALKFSPSLLDIPKVISDSVLNVKQGIKNAKSTGRIRENLAAIEDGFLPHTDSVERLRSFASTLSKISGRDSLENFSRGLSQAAGESIIGIQRKLAISGNAKAEEFLSKLANNKDWKKMSDVQLASRVVDITQGTYDVRGLPSWVINSPIAPILRLAKWNIEQLNNFHKYAVIPASKGDLTPLITTLVGGTLGGIVAKEVKEKLSAKKSQIPSWAEIGAADIATKDKLPAITYNLAAALSYSGVMGTLGEITKAGFDAAFENRPQGYNYPTVEVAADALEKTFHMTEALIDGESPVDVLPAYAADMLGRNMQLGRIGFNWLRESMDSPQAKATEARRDLRAFRQLESLPVSVTGEQSGENPYVGLKAKGFKQATTIKEGLEKGIPLIKEAIESNRGNPIAMKGELEKLKRNNYQTIPSPEENPILFKRYYDFLIKTKGEVEAKKKLADYFNQRAVNRAKSSLVPSI